MNMENIKFLLFFLFELAKRYNTSIDYLLGNHLKIKEDKTPKPFFSHKIL